eukprot:CAMPEP_0115551266 /NCGR_PEP_ID=MMETSP0271-20121206/95645_1 /TAXON_ID=71861 /ORGANISM="Scrippsiella trochoidea, Strain CCMP3099" /LENGTH=72 /DNA_ID=CAMNT_0002984867 /DNA_START=256 /DNA_END=474 /DNA_ORIENTATION=+
MRRLLVVLLVRRGIRHRAAAPAQFAASASVSVHRQMLLRRQRQEKATKKDFLDSLKFLQALRQLQPFCNPRG